MHKKSLIETNPYLKDPCKRDEMFCASTSSSIAIEGVHITAEELIKAEKKTLPKFPPYSGEESGE